jgi:hypothetical protein
MSACCSVATCFCVTLLMRVRPHSGGVSGAINLCCDCCGSEAHNGGGGVGGLCGGGGAGLCGGEGAGI